MYDVCILSDSVSSKYSVAMILPLSIPGVILNNDISKLIAPINNAQFCGDLPLPFVIPSQLPWAPTAP